MYLEFNLANANYDLDTVEYYIKSWATVRDIKYTDKVFKYTYRVSFDNDQIYLLFFMSCPEWIKYRLITDLNNKQ